MPPSRHSEALAMLGVPPMQIDITCSEGMLDSKPLISRIKVSTMTISRD